MINIIKDLSILSNISEKHITRVVNHIYYIINDAIVEANLKGENIVEIDLGIGILTIELLETSVRCKFKPSDKLVDNIEKTTITNTNPLKEQLKVNVVNQMKEVYKDFI